MNKKWLAAAGTGALLLVSAAGIAIAQAGTVPVTNGSPAITQPAQTQSVDNEVKSAVDKDNLQVQQGSKVEDTQGTDAKAGSGEKAQAKEPDAPGGHTDLNGANVNQDFQGVQ